MGAGIIKQNVHRPERVYHRLMRWGELAGITHVKAESRDLVTRDYFEFCNRLLDHIETPRCNGDSCSRLG